MKINYCSRAFAFLLIITAITLTLSGCKKEEIPTVGKEGSEPVYFLNLSVGGKTFNFQRTAVEILSENRTYLATVPPYSRIVVSEIFEDSTLDLDITLPRLQVGEFVLSQDTDNGMAHLTLLKNSELNSYQTFGYMGGDTKFIVKITKVGEFTVEGSFSGTILESVDGNWELRSILGEFRVMKEVPGEDSES